MHKFFRGSKKTIAAMMAVLMFTSSTGGYAQAGMIQDAFPEAQEIVQGMQGNTDTPATEDAETVVTKPETEVPTGEPTKDSAEGSVDNTTPEVTETPKPTEKLEEKNKDASKEITADSEKKSETSEKKETSEDSNELSNTVTRFIQEKDSYAYMEQITNMDDLLSEMNEEQLYELLYFMRLSFLSEVPEDHSQTLDAYYEILEAYLKVKSQDPKQEWQALVLPYLPYYKEGMETTEEYLNAVDGKDFDLSGLEEQLAALEETTDFDMLPAEEKKVTVEAAMESARQDIRDGKPEDAVWTMYHYGYLADVLLELDAESLEAFFQGLDNENRYVFHALAGYEYFGFVDQGYALDGYKEKADMLRYYYQECKENQAADQLLLKALNDQNRTSYASVDAYEADLEAGSSEDFASVMEAWNLYLTGKVDALVKKVDPDSVKDDASKEDTSKTNPQEPYAPDTPDTEEEGTTASGEKDLNGKDTAAEVPYPGLDLNAGIALLAAAPEYDKDTLGGQWVAISNTWYFVKPDGSILYNSWVKDGSSLYYVKSNGWCVVSAYAVINNIARYFNKKGILQAKTANGWVWDELTSGYYWIVNGTAAYGWVYTDTESTPDSAGNTYCWYYCGTADSRYMRFGGYQTINGVDYYFDAKGHWIPATIGNKFYYSVFDSEIGALDQAETGNTIVLKGGLHNVDTTHWVSGKDLGITSDGMHKCFIKNTSAKKEGSRPVPIVVRYGSVYFTGSLSLDGGDYMGKTYQSTQSDLIMAGTKGTVIIDSPDISIFNANQGLHIAQETAKGGKGKIIFEEGKIYDCAFGIGAYGDVEMSGGEIYHCGQGIHLNAWFYDLTGNITGGSIHDCSNYGIATLSSTWDPYPESHKIDLTVENTSIYGNTGNGIFMTDTLLNTSSLTVKNSLIQDNGTGIDVHKGSIAVGEQSTIQDNWYEGIYFLDTESTAAVDSALITRNGDGTYEGGGIYALGTLTTSENTVISENNGLYGGGIYSAKELQMTNSEVTNNTAQLGGGIYCLGENTITGKVTDNTTLVNDGTGDRQGAGIWNGGVTTLDATVTGNTSTGDGGGVANIGTLTMTGGSVSSNTCDNNGGGIVNYENGSFQYQSGSIQDNKAGSMGGNIRIEDSVFTLNCKTPVSGGTAGAAGGGISVYAQDGKSAALTLKQGAEVSGNTAASGAGVDLKNASCVMTGGTVSKNTASKNGGGIYLTNSTLDMQGGSVSENQAVSGAGIYNKKTLQLTGGEVSGNIASSFGGGIYNTGNATVSGTASIHNNTADRGAGIAGDGNGIDADLTVSATVSDNTASQEGGGIYYESGVIMVSGGNISRNQAAFGGGAYLLGGTVALQDGTISGNTATNKGGGFVLDGMDKATITGGTITKNTAATYGGGIYSDDTDVMMTDGSISANETDSTLGKAYYQGGTLSVGDDAQILGDIYLPVNKIINVVSDLTKADLEVSMAEDDTYKHRVIAEYAKNTTSFRNGKDDTGRYSLETATAGYARKAGLKIDDNSEDGKLYQVWLDLSVLPIRVNYIGRYADSGSVKTEVVEPGTEKYTVKKNSGYTGYSRKDYSFQGWAYRLTDKKPTYSEKLSNVISYDDLRSIWQEQQEAGISGDMFKTQSTKSSRSVAGIALAAMQNALSGLIFPAQVQAAENDQVWDVYMLDTWDKVPTIKWTENTFWEGTDVYRLDLLKNIQIRDEEDGTIDVSKLVINSITYSAGKLENGTKAASYTVNYPKGMQDSDKLDTWFMQLDKNDSPVTHVLHCSVTDSAGNVAKADITVKVKYNEFPTIDARDRYFTLEEAQSGQITEKALLQDAITDGKLSADDTEEGNMNDRLEMVDFHADDFTSFTDSGYVTVTFHVQDSMGPGGKGKETYRQIKVYVVKDGVIEEPEKAQNIRFINKKYYDLNKGVNPDTLSEEEKEARNGNGGLNVESKWYHDPEYQAVIEAAFGKTQGTDYEFTKEDIDKIKAYVDANGIGTTKSDAALDNFYSQFVAPAKVN